MDASITPPSLRSPQAFARYRKLVEDAHQTPVIVHTDFDLTDAEMTWNSLTAFEQTAFGIDPNLVNALAFAHMRYAEMIGLCDVEFDAYRDEERAAYSELFKGECAYCMDDAVAFMVLACLLPQTQCMLWVCRTKVQEVRSGLYIEHTKPPPWAMSDAVVSPDLDRI